MKRLVVDFVNNEHLGTPTLKKQEFYWIRDYLYKQAGIVLNDSKMALVTGRLDKRVRHHGLASYQDYFNLLDKPGFEQESLLAIDLLTTNETYFYREAKHFEFVQKLLTDYPASKRLRIWSAACSSGEEAYTLAMVLAEYAKTNQWEILGSDISSRILEKARSGLYPISAAEKIPKPLLKKYCLKGCDEYAGFFMIEPALRQRVHFIYANLIEKLPDLGSFDIIFLRNVMIYFDISTKQQVILRIQEYLRPGGYFIISHSESLNGIKSDLKMVSPSIYCKPD